MRNRVVLVGAIGGAVVSTVAMAAEAPRAAYHVQSLDRFVYGAAIWALRHRRLDVCPVVYCYHPRSKDEIAEAKPAPPKLPGGPTPRVTRYGAP